MNLVIALANIPPLLGLLVWPFAVLVSPMIFDAPGSDTNPLAWAFYYTLWAYPLPTLIGGILTFRYCKQNRHSRCLFSTLITYSCVLAFLLETLAAKFLEG